MSLPVSPATLFGRRGFLGAVAATAAASASGITAPSLAAAQVSAAPCPTIVPPEGKPLLISCKLTMIAKEAEGRTLTLAERLQLAGQAGFDGVDFDEAGDFTAEQAKAAVQESGVFCHNAINHAHWRDTLTSPDPAVRARGVANISHCLRVAHAIGGSGVLIVIGKADDGSEAECEERVEGEIRKLLPLAAALGQPILFENVWNRLHYDHNAPPEQSAERFVRFVDRFNSPWVGMYYDIGNHWKYGQPRQWLQEFGHRAVKLDVKGFSRAQNKWADIASADDDLPWDQVRLGLQEIGFCGWATAEVGGGGLERLTTVRKQMQTAFGLA